MELLVIAGAAALIGAYASSRHSRDRELARLEKKARRDAKAAHKKGDVQASAYYLQVARDFAVQRLQEAEQRAINEAYKHQTAGKVTKAAEAQRKADEIRRRLETEFHVHSHPTPSTSLPVASPQSADSLPAIQPYATYVSHSPYTPTPQGQTPQPQPAVFPGPVLYSSLTPTSRSGPRETVVYYGQYDQHGGGGAYPAVPPPAYTPPAVPSISSAPTQPVMEGPPVKHR